MISNITMLTLSTIILPKSMHRTIHNTTTVYARLVQIIIILC